MGATGVLTRQRRSRCLTGDRCRALAAKSANIALLQRTLDVVPKRVEKTPTLWWNLLASSCMSMMFTKQSPCYVTLEATITVKHALRPIDATRRPNQG
jgi:hypothetical protein